ncbi:glycosyltransferase family 39 protein [Telmatospirillum sp.]|uniref:ArnT family glycosyltransferase n=1 Tax=Telmatospirillum sp. TaxID=2079197 RepID=UPI00284B05E0|nr:glycosyltransferase family 39 protein [Telmatospirillum sp.]MDR3436339.1 glycosyltransferase family 39 protein [Telmatospirillum sp.]
MQSSRTLASWRSRLLPIERWALVGLLAITALRLLVADLAPLSSDEAYYWQWTRPLQLSYFDHPAMVALWIWPGIHLLGDTALGVRLAAVLGGLATSLVVWDATRLAFASRPAGAMAALWLNAVLLFGAAGVVITPDSPLLLCWATVLWALIRLIADGHPRFLYIAGLALGLGAVSKYTIALILPGICVTFLLFSALRPWWRRTHAWLAVLLALACTTPVVLWNSQNHWASFAKQLGHAFATEITDPMKNLLVFLSSQIGLVTPLIFLFGLWGMGWALLAGWRQRRPEWFLLGATSLPVLVFFALHTQSGVVQSHWSGPAYLGGIMAAVGGFMHVPRRRFVWAFRAAPLLGAAMTLVVYVQAATALLPLPPGIDALKRLGGWDTLATAVEAERQAHPGSFLFSQKHEPTGPVSFHIPDHPPVFLEGHIRPSYYSAAEVLALKGRDGIFITRTKDDGARDLGPYFTRVTLLRQVVLMWGGQPADTYNLYLAENYRGGLFVIGAGFDGALDTP